MREEEKGILNNIKSVYGNLTTLEKEIADFFLNRPDIKGFFGTKCGRSSVYFDAVADKICPEMRIFRIQAVFV